MKTDLISRYLPEFVKKQNIPQISNLVYSKWTNNALENFYDIPLLKAFLFARSVYYTTTEQFSYATKYNPLGLNKCQFVKTLITPLSQQQELYQLPPLVKVCSMVSLKPIFQQIDNITFNLTDNFVIIGLKVDLQDTFFKSQWIYKKPLVYGQEYNDNKVYGQIPPIPYSNDYGLEYLTTGLDDNVTFTKTSKLSELDNDK